MEMEKMLLAVGIGLAMLGGALGTGWAQANIGPAVVGACAEDRKFLGVGLLFLAFPETILILSLGMAYLLYQKM
jgi:V/A-type H+-transporting ATPase subunit K